MGGGDGEALALSQPEEDVEHADGVRTAGHSGKDPPAPGQKPPGGCVCGDGLEDVHSSCRLSTQVKVVYSGIHWSSTTPVSPRRFFRRMHSAMFVGASSLL